MAELASEATTEVRRDEIARAAKTLSRMIHLDGIGDANAAMPGGGEGWYRALVGAVIGNLNDLEELLRKARWRWATEWPYVLVDMLVVAALIAVVVSIALP